MARPPAARSGPTAVPWRLGTCSWRTNCRAGRAGAVAADGAAGDCAQALALRCPAAVCATATSGCFVVAEAGARRMLEPSKPTSQCARRAATAAGMDAAGASTRMNPNGFHRRRAASSITSPPATCSRSTSARLERALRSARRSRPELFQRLRTTNPAPFAGPVRRRGFAVVSASPEQLVSVRGDPDQTQGRPWSQPIAGAPAIRRRRRRGCASATWSAHPKERRTRDADRPRTQRPRRASAQAASRSTN